MKRGFIKKSLVIIICLCAFGFIQNAYALETYTKPAAPVNANNNDNYLEEVYQKYKQIVYWPKNYLLVYIPDDARASFVWSQFKVWENVLGGTITFERVPFDRNADIIVHYENPYIAKKVGFTRLSYKDGAVIHADMFIYDDILTNPLKNYAVLHEIGHALGITNHSSNPGDIMYQTKTALQNGLSVRDKNTIKMIYDINSRQANVSNSPIPEFSLKGDDLKKADMLFDGAQYEAALQAYKKASAIDTEAAEAYMGMASCYFAMGNDEQAWKYAKKAVNNNINNRELIYPYMRIGLSTNHSKELKKFLDKYINDYPDAMADKEIQSIMTLIQDDVSSNKKNKK